MDVKLLLGIVGRPWLIEPGAAQYWNEAVSKMLSGHAAFTAPMADKRRYFTRAEDFGNTYRVNESGAIDAAGSIQVYVIDGPVSKQDYCGAPGSLSLTQMLAGANTDTNIIGHLLYIDSPGGMVDGTENFGNAIRNSPKPVVAFTDYMMASAAYWFGSQCSEIVVDGANNGWNAKIGSIGTMRIYEDDREKMAKEGIKQIPVFADASSDKWGDYFSAMNGDFTRAKQELNGLNDTFLAAVKSGRGDRLTTKENVLSGKVYNANEALQHGLIDSIGSFTDAVKRVAVLAKSNSSTPKITTTTRMSTKNLVFQNTLTAAKATEFSVVEGGFLMTEEHLNNIEARLDQDATTASATAAQLKTLQAQSASFANHDAIVQDLATTKTALATATASLATATTDLTTASAKIVELGKKPGALFGATTTQEEAGDTGGERTPEQIMAALPHNKAVDELIG